MTRCEAINSGNIGNMDPGSFSMELQVLSEEQRASMSEDAQVALAIAEIDREQEILIAGELTTALATRTKLSEEAVKKANRDLLQKTLLDREGFAEPGSTKALQLSLNEKGYKFLDEALQQALNHDS